MFPSSCILSEISIYFTHYTIEARSGVQERITATVITGSAVKCLKKKEKKDKDHGSTGPAWAVFVQEN